MLVHAFFLLGQTINHETVKLLDNDPEIISSTATILRLQDDLGSAKVRTNRSLNRYSSLIC